jgi:hypothetical protein
MGSIIEKESAIYANKENKNKRTNPSDSNSSTLSDNSNDALSPMKST